MKPCPDLIICEHCDSVFRRQPLAPGEVARCSRCAAVLYSARQLNVDAWLALTLTAAVAFAVANLCPVVRIGLQGLHNEATLWQSVLALAHGPAAPIAVPTALAIIFVPLFQIGLLIWALTFARLGRRAPGFAQIMRLLVGLRPWSMVEVGLLGILVAVVKLSSFLQVAPGPGIWAMAALMVLITLIANRDLHGLWDMTEELGPHQEVKS